MSTDKVFVNFTN